MNDNEKIQSFGDMVEATEKLSSPWRKANFVQMVVLILTNLFWAIIVALLVHYAYMAPVEVYQGQDFSEQSQTQDYSSGYTQGE